MWFSVYIYVNGSSLNELNSLVTKKLLHVKDSDP